MVGREKDHLEYLWCGKRQRVAVLQPALGRGDGQFAEAVKERAGGELRA